MVRFDKILFGTAIIPVVLVTALGVYGGYHSQLTEAETDLVVETLNESGGEMELERLAAKTRLSVWDVADHHDSTNRYYCWDKSGRGGSYCATN